jgi:poly(3-hydroxybutyrate) depolymerase
LLLFHADAGYNEWAEAHGLLVLYPQTTAWGAANDIGKNPRGCWDWWGYSGSDYFRKSGPQIRAVDAMVRCLRSNGPCE